MENCEYKHQRANSKRKCCLIDHRRCDYKGDVELCPVYHSYQNLIPDKHSDRGGRYVKNLPDIVINININTR